ncbi:hypothetical protein SAMN05216420_104143 [Nitrosospira sp. Nl5]|uniref:hypothetical protein n=1 Tax=Nitrosospira sp. Nl5 TaxID=200120 RepID=UPI000888BBBE|nr:hypothetical protein [Nitrosospira sp. Nl5]SCY29440.1 hypothetical protein SAMN05216420_104143 [Nitrosospira sp. Nl5]
MPLSLVFTDSAILLKLLANNPVGVDEGGSKSELVAMDRLGFRERLNRNNHSIELLLSIG